MPKLMKLATGKCLKEQGRKGGKAPAQRKTLLPTENRCEMTVPTYSSTPPASSSFQTVATSTAETCVINAPSLNASVVNAPAGSVNLVDIASFHFMSPTPTYFPPYLLYRPPNAVSVDPVSGGKKPISGSFHHWKHKCAMVVKDNTTKSKVHLTIHVFSMRSGIPILS